MAARLAGKTILVTGAAGAIGGATARRLSDEGARLFLADRDAAPLASLAGEIASTGAPPPLFGVYDAASSKASAALVHEAVAGLSTLDGVCNIAGAYAKARSDALADADWARILQVNLTSAFIICREALPHLRRSRGCVVSTSSLAALEGLAYATAYAVAKAGIIAMTKSLAAEFAADGVRFNAVCPGAIRSAMSGAPAVPDADPDLAFRRSKLQGFGGYGAPQDVAAAFAYLLSDDARFVSGATLVIDGAQFLM